MSEAAEASNSDSLVSRARRRRVRSLKVVQSNECLDLALGSGLKQVSSGLSSGQFLPDCMEPEGRHSRCGYVQPGQRVRLPGPSVRDPSPGGLG